MEREHTAFDPVDELELIDRIRREGDMDAFEALYRRYVGRIYAFAYRRTGSQMMAEDVTSATFEKVLRNIPTFRWKGGGFEPWVFQIAANELTTHFRRDQRSRGARAIAAMRALSPDRTPADATEHGVLSADELAVMRRALDRLNPRYQQVLALRYLAGLSHPEVAAAMGVTKPVLSVLVHRALGALRRELERDTDGRAPTDRGPA